MAGFRTDLLTGLAVLLDDAGAGTWRSSGIYQDAETAIVLATMPSRPDRVITLTGYGVGDDPSLSDSTEGVQVRCRWGGEDPRPVDDLADLVFDALHGLPGVTLATGIRVTQSLRRSSVSLGQDANRRWSRSDNYYLDAWRPSTHRT